MTMVRRIIILGGCIVFVRRQDNFFYRNYFEFYMYLILLCPYFLVKFADIEICSSFITEKHIQISEFIFSVNNIPSQNVNQSLFTRVEQFAPI